MQLYRGARERPCVGRCKTTCPPSLRWRRRAEEPVPWPSPSVQRCLAPSPARLCGPEVVVHRSEGEERGLPHDPTTALWPTNLGRRSAEICGRCDGGDREVGRIRQYGGARNRIRGLRGEHTKRISCKGRHTLRETQVRACRCHAVISWL